MPASKATISIPDLDEARRLFGPHDAHLRAIRDALPVKLTFRDGVLSCEGDADHVARTIETIRGLRDELRRTGALSENDVIRTLPARDLDEVAAMDSIDLFEKAKTIRPRTPGQARYVQMIREHDLVFCSGPAGCGKTFLAVAMAVNALRTEAVRKIVLVRPAVEAGEKLGFLPGDLLAKVNPFLRPLLDALNDMLAFDVVKRYMETDVVEIVPLAFMRGRTLNETFIILDEAQNTTVTQMKMFLTRMGEGSKIVVTGDATQTDLPDDVTSGLGDAIRRLTAISGVGTVELTGKDIVRHRLVRRIVAAYEGEQQGSEFED